MSKMRKIQLLGLALFVVLAFGALAAAAAYAEPEWLVEKTTFVGSLPAETEGLIVLTKLVSESNSELLNEISCEAIFDGSITSSKTDEITKILNLSKEEIGTLLEGLALDCLVVQAKETADCRLNALAEVWAEELPWATELELMSTESELILDLILNMAYEYLCESGILGIFISDLCNGKTSMVMTNDLTTTPPSVDGLFTSASEELDCAITGARTGALMGLGSLRAIGGTVASPEVLNRLETAVND
jgi:hypothetical protein